MEDVIRLGVVGAAHGLQGAFFLREVHDLGPLLQLKRVLVGSKWFAVKCWRSVGAGVLLHLVGLTGRESAEALRGQAVFADLSEYRLEPGRFFYHRLIGLPVLNPAGLALGVVVDVLDNGAQDVLALECNGSQAMVPLQAPYVKVHASHVELDPIPGLLD